MARLSPKDTPAMKLVVIEAYKDAPSMRSAALRAGADPGTVRLWMKSDEEFAEAMEASREEWRDNLRENVSKRATGFERPMFHKGEPVYKRDPLTGDLEVDDDFNPIQVMEPVYSERMLELMSRGHLPEHKQTKGGGSVGVAIGGGDGKTPPTKVVVNFVDAPDWDNVEWDPETGRAKLETDNEPKKSDGSDTGVSGK